LLIPDLKLENVLLHNRNSFPRLLIGDFGYSTTLETLIDSAPPGNGDSTRDNFPAGTLLNLPPERLKSFTKTTKTSGLGESLHGQARKEKIGKQWFEEEMELDHWGLGGEYLRDVMIDYELMRSCHVSSHSGATSLH
jgi:serine/threonine protein kinase